MSFLAASPDLPEQDPQRKKHDFNGVLPEVHGTAKVPFRLIEKPWNYWEEETGSNGQPPGHYYQLAGWVCLGEVDELRAIRVNGKPFNLFWKNPYDASEYADVEIYHHWKHTPVRFRFYWGKQEQAADPLLTGVAQDLDWEAYQFGDGRVGGPSPGSGPVARREPAGGLQPAPNIHPPYGGICYVVFLSFMTGFQNGGVRGGGPNLPPIEFDVYRKTATITVGNEWAAGVNPVATAYEWLTDPRAGLGLGNSIVPQAAWQDGAERCRAYRWRGLNLLSPALARPEEAAGAIANLMSYYGGFLRARDGQLLPGIRPGLGSPENNLWVGNARFGAAGEDSVFAEWDVVASGSSGVARDTAETERGGASCRIDPGPTGMSAGVQQELTTMDLGTTYEIMIRAKATAIGDLQIGTPTDPDTYGIISIGIDWQNHWIQIAPTTQVLRITTAPGSFPDGSCWIDHVWGRQKITTLTEHDVVGSLSWTPGDSEAYVSEVSVTYTSLADNLGDSTFTERQSLPAFVRGDEPRTEEVKAPFALTPDAARELGRRRMQENPGKGSGTFLRRSVVDPAGQQLLAGDVVRINYAPWQWQAAVRIISVTDSAEETVEIEFALEDGLDVEEYEPVEDTRLLPPEPVAAPMAATYAVQLPPLLAGQEWPPAVAILAERGNASVNGYRLYLSTAASNRWTGEEDDLGRYTGFGVSATLDGSIGAASSSILLDVPSTEYDYLLSEGFSAEAAKGNAMLLYIPSTGEWISLAELVSNSGTQWEFSCLRGRYNTQAAIAGFGTPAFLVLRERISLMQHPALAVVGTEAYFRLAPTTIAGEGTPDPEISLTIVDPRPAAPSNFQAESGTEKLIKQGDGTIVVRALLTWDSVFSSEHRDRQQYEIQYKRSNSADWQTYNYVDQDVLEMYVSPVEEADYDFRVRGLTSYGTPGEWSTITDYTVIGKTASPAAPEWRTDNPVVAGYGYIDLHWENPSDVDFALTILERNPDKHGNGIWGWLNWGSFNWGDNREGFYRDTDVEGDVTYYYRLKAYDTSGNGSENYDVKTASITGFPAPSEVTNLAVTGVNGGIKITWTNPTESYHMLTQVWRKKVYDYRDRGTIPNPDPYEQIATVHGDQEHYIDFVKPEWNAGYNYMVKTVSKNRDNTSNGVSTNKTKGYTPRLPVPLFERESVNMDVVGFTYYSIQIRGNQLEDRDKIVIWSDGSMPGGTERDTVYYVKRDGGRAPNFYYKLFTHPSLDSDSEIQVTSRGSGNVVATASGFLKGRRRKLEIHVWSNAYLGVSFADDDSFLSDGDPIRFYNDIPSGVVEGKVYYVFYGASGYWHISEDPLGSSYVSGFNYYNPTNSYAYPQYVDVEWSVVYSPYLSHIVFEYTDGEKRRAISVSPDSLSVRLRDMEVKDMMEVPIYRTVDRWGVELYDYIKWSDDSDDF